MKRKHDKKKFVGIDLFSGAGGMSLGARSAGIEVIFAVEKCHKAAATYHLNFPETKMQVGDIRDLTTLPRKPRGVGTVVFGGPPCQGFSTSNQRTRSSQNPSNWLYKEFSRIVREWQPDWVVMENVKGITETEGGCFVRSVIEDLDRSGYTTSFKLLNALDFGVPQSRTRAFFVGSRRGDSFAFPTGESKPPISVKTAIRDLPSLQNGASVDELPYRHNPTSSYVRRLRNGNATVRGNLVTKNATYVIERYKHVPVGGNWRDIPADLLDNYADRERCHEWIYRRLDPTRPSVVIGNFRKNMLIHPDEDRGLSIREAARIQSVPDDFNFCGSIGFQQQQVGNMVPPFLAQSVFSKVLDS